MILLLVIFFVITAPAYAGKVEVDATIRFTRIETPIADAVDQCVEDCAQLEQILRECDEGVRVPEECFIP